MKTLNRLFTYAALILPFTLLPQVSAHAEEKTDFKVAWSLYVGWLPLGYANDTGIVKKWADRYGINIEMVQFNDYIESITQYTSGDIDSVVLTNMDALSIPAAGGVDTTAFLLGDYSNGNDAIILKNTDNLADIKGQEVSLVEYSVSHYLLARALHSVGLSERDVSLTNTSDSDMIAAFETPGVNALVSWNPTVSTVLQNPAAKVAFDSSQLPGEIIDIGIVKTDVLQDNPNFAKAMTGIWYESAALLKANTPEGETAREAMAEMAGTDVAGLQQQLAATHLFDQPAEALEFIQAPALKDTMSHVSDFLLEKGLIDMQASSSGAIGIQMPDGAVIGNADNVTLRFTDTYIRNANAGELSNH
ncbi:MAG TPA: lipid kinase [Pseudomonas pachastrellae]|nr:lipid kinase [Halopseudomonas pachastrellae]